jgi:hypothetical protein
MEDFGVCSKECNVWGSAPANFRETKHFLKCPKCNSPMYLTREPLENMEAYYGKANRVDNVGVMPHNESN